MSNTETNDDIAWRLLREARYAKPSRKVEACRRAAACLDEGPCDDAGLLDEMHTELAEIEAKIPEWQRR